MVHIFFLNNEKKFINKIFKNINQDTLLIVPDQYSFYAEKFIYEQTKNIDFKNNLEVFSFKKLCFKIFKEFGFIAGKFADKSTKISILNICLFKLKKELKFKDIVKNNSVPQIILKSIEELEKNNISPKIFKKKINKIKDVNLKNKAKNFLKIFELYENILNKNYKNPTQNLKKAIKFSIENNIFKNTKIYFLLFFKFNILELSLIEVMMKQGNLMAQFSAARDMGTPGGVTPVRRGGSDSGLL